VGVADVKQRNHPRILAHFAEKVNHSAEIVILCGCKSWLSE
jgi:hypothetical protein